MSDPLDVTGAWEGIFSYPRSLPANGFRCELREHGGRIAGETRERSDAGYAVSYLGTIAGRWEIPGVWSGRFIMVRQSRRGVAEERQVPETVR